MDLDSTVESLRSETAQAGGIVVAFSGGADSVLSLHIAVELAVMRSDLLVFAWYCHHYASPVEPERQRIIDHTINKIREKIGDRFLFVMRKADVTAINRRLQTSWEHAASLIRRKHLLRLIEKLKRQNGNQAVVFTGHNHSDYLETLALRRLRKIPEANLPTDSRRDETTGFLRPLFGLSRAGIRQLAKQMRLPYFEDPSNTDLSVARNRIREQSDESYPPVTDRPNLRATARTNFYHRRELRLPAAVWHTMETPDKARTVYNTFRQLAIVRKFTRNHFSRAHVLPFALPPFFAHRETIGTEELIIFRRGLGASVALPAAENRPYLRGNVVSRGITVAMDFGHKSVTKLFSERRLSPRQRRRTILYFDAPESHKATGLVYAPEMVT